MAFHVDVDAFLYLGVGKDQATKQTVVTLSPSNSVDSAPVASIVASAIDGSTNSLLASVASELLATSVIQNVASGSSVLVHLSGKERLFAAALSQQAAAKGIRVTFSCDEESNADVQDPEWIKLNARATRHIVRKSLAPAKATHFLDLTTLSHETDLSLSLLSLSIVQVLPPKCKRIEPADLSRYQSLLPQRFDTKALVSRLENAVSNVSKNSATVTAEEIQGLVIPLDQLQVRSLVHHTTSVVDWASEEDIQVEVRPLDATRLFAANKTYLLVDRKSVV